MMPYYEGNVVLGDFLFISSLHLYIVCLFVTVLHGALRDLCDPSHTGVYVLVTRRATFYVICFVDVICI